MGTDAGSGGASARWPIPDEPDLHLPLVISSYTLGTEVSFQDRVQAAAAAGFDGIGLRAENYWDAAQSGLSGVAMAELARGAGVPVLEVEYLTGWGSATDRDQAQQRKEQTVFEMARTFGVRHLNAGLLEQLPLPAMVEAFAALCDRAGDDLTIALEFMPYSGVPDVTTAWRILQAADRPNSALIVDVWHWARAASRAADLDPIPAERMVAVQLCDVQRTPMTPLRTESLGHRLPPGDGFGDAAGLVQTLRSHGVRPAIVAVEVISHQLVAGGVDAAARTVAAAAHRVLTDAAEPEGS